MNRSTLERIRERQAARRLRAKLLRQEQKKLADAHKRLLVKQRERTKAWKAANPDKVAAQRARYRDRYYAKRQAQNAFKAAQMLKNGPIDPTESLYGPGGRFHTEPPVIQPLQPPDPSPAPEVDPASYRPDWLDSLKSTPVAVEPPQDVDNG